MSQTPLLKILIAVFLFITVAAFSYSLGVKSERKSGGQSGVKTQVGTTPNTQTNLWKNLIDPNGPQKELVVDTSLTQIFRGNLVSFTKGSWTIKSGETTLTLTQEDPNRQVAYRSLSKEASKIVAAKEEDLKVGDLLDIAVRILPEDGKRVITSITISR